MKVFISQPMQGKTKEQILAEREEVVRSLEAAGHEVIQNCIPDIPPATKNQALFCLGASLQILATCDAVHFMPGWYKARGCKLECFAAGNYGIPVVDKNGDPA